MRTRATVSSIFLALWMVTPVALAATLGTAVTYQGSLKDAGAVVNGPVDLKFTLFDAEANGNVVGATVIFDGQAGHGLPADVADGLFTVRPDFGANVFDGTALWLEIEVRIPHDPSDTAPYDTLDPRQPLTAAPIALQTRGIFVNQSTGNVGIGTTAPERLLHVANGDAGVTPHSNSRLVVERNATAYLNLITPDSAESGILFGVPTGGSASGGIVYNPGGNPNGLQFRTNGNQTRMAIDSGGNVGVGTTAPAGKLHVVDATGGDGSVVFPTDAIGALEVQDEPGVAESEFNPTVTLDGTLQTLRSTTITAPAPGYALVIATTQCIFAHEIGTLSSTTFGVSNSSASLPQNQDVGLIVSSAAPTGSYFFPVTVHGIFSANTGSNTYYFLGREESGVVSAQDFQLSVVYLPTAYGAVALEGEERLGEDDDARSVGEPMTSEDVMREQIEAMRIHEQRIRRERELLAAETEELRALKNEVQALCDDMGLRAANSP